MPPFSVDPSWIRLAVVVAAVVRATPTLTLPEPTDVVRPSSFSRSALPVMLEFGAGRRVQRQNASTGVDGADQAGNHGGTQGIDGLGNAAGEINRLEHVGKRAGAQIDARIAVSVGDDVAADAGSTGNRRRCRGRARLEGDGLAVDDQDVAILRRRRGGKIRCSVCSRSAAACWRVWPLRCPPLTRCRPAERRRRRAWS